MENFTDTIDFVPDIVSYQDHLLDNNCVIEKIKRTLKKDVGKSFSLRFKYLLY